MTAEWDHRFLDLAKMVAGWSKDPSTKTGAVIVANDKRVISMGYNGFPRGIDDDTRLDIRELKYKIIVHCERNAMLFARQPLDGCILYTWPFISCSVCAGMVIQAGITRHVAPVSTHPRFGEDTQLSRELFREAGVVVDLLVREDA